MLLYLSSYKFGEKTEELREWINSHDNKLLLISNALDSKDEEKIKKTVEEDIKLLTKIGFEVKEINLKEYFHKPEKLRKEFSGYNAYCVMGGNVFVLRQAMKLSGLDEFLKDISLNDEYLYIGYSAGSCVLSDDLTVLNIVDDPISFYNNDNVIYEGVGLIDFVIVPHYKSDYHKAHLIDEIVEKCQKENIKFQTIKNGEVIILNSRKSLKH